MKTLAFYWTKTAIKWTLKGFRKYTRRIKFSNKTIFLCRLSWFFCTWLNRSHRVGYNSTKDKYSVQCPGVQLPLYCSNNHLEMLLYSFPSTSQIERLAEVSKFWFEEGRRAEGQDVMWGKIKYFRNTKYSFLLGQIWQCRYFRKRYCILKAIKGISPLDMLHECTPVRQNKKKRNTEKQKRRKIFHLFGTHN